MSIYIIAGIIFLILLLLIMTVIQQQKRRLELKKRAAIASFTLSLENTEDLLTKITSIPVTKSLMVILHTRILEAEKSIYALTHDNVINSQITDRKQLIDSINQSFESKGLDTFRLPSDEREILQIVQLLKKIKVVITSEHRRGRVNPEIFANEIKRADLLQIRININAILSRARVTMQTNQAGSARTYLEKAIKTLRAINSESDTFVNAKLQQAQSMLAEIDQVQNKIDLEERIRKEKEIKKNTDLDLLFQPKKKW